MMIELSFADGIPERRNIVLIKYLDVAASAVAFWFFGFEISNINGDGSVFQNTVIRIDPISCNAALPYIVWFFKFGFASNTATLMGGLLIKCKYKLRIFSAFMNAFIVAGIIHPVIARFIWGGSPSDFLSPYRFCDKKVDANAPLLDRIYLLDFAGGGAVHLVGGMASLALTLLVSFQLWWDKKKKKEETKEEAPKKNKVVAHIKGFFQYMYPRSGGDDVIEYAALGVFILWFGWFAFNCGTTESLEGPFQNYPVYSRVAGRIAVNMITCAAGGCLTATLIASVIQTVTKGKAINCNEIANGILTALVAITSNCPYVDNISAFFIGIIAVFLYHIGVYLEYAAGIWDTGRVIPVHAVGGMWSLLASALFVLHDIPYEYVRETYEGICYCKLRLPFLQYYERLGAQILGIVFISIFSFVLAFVFYLIFFVIRLDFLFKIGKTSMGEAITKAFKLGPGGILLISQDETEVDQKGEGLEFEYRGDSRSTLGGIDQNAKLEVT